ncbi:GntR family transcriptional regulator [Robbsia sp. Bb-Pol-6]|uniref:GntR family transcriptional regulator n=1 Tax=Robbsia betulipollinis TaxID=2981849 RepID=A0ABT3ZHQ5_9BURK|nr:GntR family transcriptional regulator [Robbsia betulipollinis]MCY0386056.1 GntR family transcriptional regulator [Robbsia betulipollinis]
MKKHTAMVGIAPVRPLAEQVYETIRDAICVGEFASGARMSEDSLAAALDVSRQPVHQALRQLHREGFLQEAGRRGLVVVPMSIELAEHVFDLRAALDETAAANAARRADASTRQQGETILRAGRRAVAARDIPAMIDADFRFHCYIYELSGNPLIETFATMNWHHVRRVATALSTRLLSLAPLWQEHEDILVAVRDGNAAAAGSLARHHVEKVAGTLKTFGTAPFDAASGAAASGAAASGGEAADALSGKRVREV